METFVRISYFASMVVFCAGIGLFLVWDSAALSRWSRRATRAEHGHAPDKTQNNSPRAARGPATPLVQTAE